MMAVATLLILICIGVLALAAWPRRSRSAGTRVPTQAERAAQWDIRMGQHRAAQRLEAAARAQAFDERAIVRPAVRPKLPADRKPHLYLVPHTSAPEQPELPLRRAAQ